MLSKQQPQSQITTRISLRWLPEDPFETTDTLVLTAGEWYVDLRVDKKTGKMDWAIAGQCLVTDQNPRRIVFTHEIDSHHNFNISNPCPFISLPDGDELETGTMARPDKPGSPMTDYEEIWRHLPRRKGPEGPAHGVSWILESDGGALGEGRYNITKVFMGRIGATYLALHQEQVHVRSRASDGELLVKIAGGDVSARREEWFDGHWEVKYNLGPSSGDLPSMAKDVEEGRQGQWRIPGEKVTVGGHVYIVRAFEEGV